MNIFNGYTFMNIINEVIGYIGNKCKCKKVGNPKINEARHCAYTLIHTIKCNCLYLSYKCWCFSVSTFNVNVNGRCTTHAQYFVFNCSLNFFGKRKKCLYFPTFQINLYASNDYNKGITQNYGRNKRFSGMLILNIQFTRKAFLTNS